MKTQIPFCVSFKHKSLRTSWSKKFWRQRLQTKIKNTFYRQYNAITAMGF